MVGVSVCNETREEFNVEVAGEKKSIESVE